MKTNYFKFFPLVFVIVALVLAFLFSSASAVGVDDTAASSLAASAGATVETEGTEESTEEQTIYYDDTELLEKLDTILSLLQEEKDSTTGSDFLQSAQNSEELLKQILQELQNYNISVSDSSASEEVQTEQGLQYQQYMLGFMIFFVLVVLCYFVYKFFNMFF